MSSAIEMESSGGRASNDSAVPYVSFPQLSSLLPYSAYVVLFVDGLVREPADEMKACVDRTGQDSCAPLAGHARCIGAAWLYTCNLVANAKGCNAAQANQLGR